MFLTSLAIIFVTVQLWTWVFWVISVYFNIRNTLQKSGTFLLVHPVYIGCPRRKGQNFGRVFLMLKYTDITQNTYIQSWTVTEMAREKCGLLAGLRTVPCQLTAYRMSVPDCRVRLQKYRWRSYVITPLWLLCMSCIVLGTLKDNYDVSAVSFCSSI